MAVFSVLISLELPRRAQPLPIPNKEGKPHPAAIRRSGLAGLPRGEVVLHMLPLAPGPS